MTWDLEEEGPASTMSAEARFIKFKHANVGMALNPCGTFIPTHVIYSGFPLRDRVSGQAVHWLSVLDLS